MCFDALPLTPMGLPRHLTVWANRKGERGGMKSMVKEGSDGTEGEEHTKATRDQWTTSIKEDCPTIPYPFLVG